MKSRLSRRQRGYVMLAIMLVATFMAIGALSIARLYVGEIKRDQEMELVHRGAEYSRAVRKFYRKFRRYPSNLEQLENTNQMRFLRRRYKDPITGQDFKIVHFGEVQLQAKGQGSAPGTPAANLAQGTGASGQTTGSNQPASPFTTAGGAPVAGGTMGGAPIIGVESTSKKVSIMEFNGKNHYNEWEFIYDPSFDRGGLIKGPYNGQAAVLGAPGMQGVPGQGVPGQGTVPGQTGFPNMGGPGQQPTQNPINPR